MVPEKLNALLFDDYFQERLIQIWKQNQQRLGWSPKYSNNSNIFLISNLIIMIN